MTVSVDGSGAAGVAGFAAVDDFDIVIPHGAESASGTFTLAPEPNAAAGTAETVTISGTAQGEEGAWKADERPVNGSATIALADAPLFAAEDAIPDQGWVTDTAIAALVLPTATGGAALLAYTLMPDLPAGVSFDGEAVTGTPTETAAATAYTWTVTDADGHTDALTFDITVTAEAPTTLTFTAVVNPVNEDAGKAEVRARLNRPAPTGGVRVTGLTVLTDAAILGADTAATAGTDFTLPADFTIPAGESSVSVDIVIIDDDLLEGDEVIIPDATTEPALTVIGDRIVIADDERPPSTLTLAADATEVDEDVGTVAVTATLDHPAPEGGVTVTLAEAATPGTAALGSDWALPSPATIAIAAGDTSGSANLTVTDDESDEPGQTIVLTASTDTTPALDAPDLTIAIDDNDPLPVVSVGADPPDVDEGDSGAGGTFTFTLELDRASDKEPEVDWVIEGSAERLTDYTGAGSNDGGSVVFGPGETSRDIVLTVVPDTFDEPDETVRLRIAAVDSNVTSGARTASAFRLIVDDDGTPTTLTLSAPAEVDETAGRVRITATLDQPAPDGGVTVTVAQAATPGTATLDSDWTLVDPPTVFIPEGDRSAGSPNVLEIEQDSALELAETIVLTATTGAPLNLTAPDLTISIVDDENTAPAFGSGAAIENRIWKTRVAVSTLRLPTATGGNGALTYTLTPELPAGLTFDAAADPPTVTGTPTEGLATTQFTYTVTDTDLDNGAADSAALTFDLTVTELPVVSLRGTTVTVSEGVQGGEATLCIDFSKAPTEEFQLRLDSTDVTATGNVDYQVVSRDATVSAGSQLSRCVTFEIVDDSIDEGGETFTVALSVQGDNAEKAFVNPDAAMATWTITDNDDAPDGIDLSADTQSVAEGGGAADIRVTATVAGDTTYSGVTTVTVSVAGSGEDNVVGFTAVDDFDIAIPDGGTSAYADFTLTPVDDTLDQSDETVTLQGAAAGEEGAHRAGQRPVNTPLPTVTLTDDDEDTAPAFAQGAEIADKAWTKGVDVGAVALPAATGGNGDLAYTLAPDISAFGLTFDAAADPPTIAGAPTSTLADDPDTPVDETLFTYTVTDADFENPESAALTFNVAIDDPPVVAVAAQSVGEGDGETTLTVTRTGNLTVASSASYAFTDGTATGGGTDYTGTGGTVSFAVNETSATIPVTIVQDTIDEDPDETFTVTLSVPSGATLGTASAVITITDDDDAPTRVVLSLDGDPNTAGEQASVDEGGGAQTVTVKASLDGGTTRAEATVVTVTVAADTATETTDYTATVADPFEIEIPAATVSGTGTFSIIPVDDSIDDDAETLSVTGSTEASVGLAVTGADLTIADDDEVPAKPAKFAAAAGNAQVTLSWDDPGDSSIEKYQIRQWESADSEPATWTDIASSDADTVSHTVTGLTNATEYSFRIRAVNATGDGAQSDAATATPADAPAKPANFAAAAGNAQATLSWDDPSDSSIEKYQLRQWASADSEPATWTDIAGSDADTVSHTVTGLTNGTAYSFRVRAVGAGGDGAQSDIATATPVAVTGADSSPAPTVVGDDITATVGGTNVKLTLPSGHGVSAVTFSVPTPAVAAPDGVTFGDDPAYVDIDLGTASLSSDAAVCLAEPSGLSGTLALYHLSDGGTAWTGLDAPASTPTGFVCGETSDFSSFVVGKQEATLALSIVETIEHGGETVPGVSEGESADVALVVTATLSAPLASAVELTLEDASGTGDRATLDEDWSLPEDLTTTIEAGDTTATWTVTIVHDADEEYSETFTLRATATAPALSADLGIRIGDNDDAPVLDRIEKTADVDEGDSGTGATITFTVYLTGATDKTRLEYLFSPYGVDPNRATFLLPYDTYTGAEDYALETDTPNTWGVLKYAKGQASADIVFRVFPDTDGEPDERFYVAVTSDWQDSEAIRLNSAPATIRNDDLSMLSLSAAPNPVDEDDGPAVVTATLNEPAPEGGVTVTLAEAKDEDDEPLGSAALDTDWSLPSPATISIAAGETSGEANVAITNDSLDEPDETIVLTATTGAPLDLTAPDLTVTIDDDDPEPTASIAITAEEASVTEGTDSEVSATIGLDAASARRVKVGWSTNSGTARSDSDYTGSGSVLTFAPGETTKTVTVPILDDDKYEPEVETFTISLDPDVPNSNAQLHATDTSVTVMITSDDAAPVIALAAQTVGEGAGATTLAVTRSGDDLSVASSASYTFTDGTATGSGTDYTGTDGTVSFAANETAATIRVTIVQDTRWEDPDETFTVTLSAPSGATLDPETPVTMTITDDDAEPVAVSIPDANLRAGLEAALGKSAGDTITDAELAGLTKLEVEAAEGAAESAKVSDLTGLAYAVGLRTLDLTRNALESDDLTHIAGLSALRNLFLEYNAISDVSSLKDLTGLRDLRLYDNDVTDIEPLVENTGLGSGDSVDLRINSLDYPSVNTHVPALTGRGVTVNFFDRTPTTLTVVSGDDQAGPGGEALAAPFVVRVDDEDGDPFEGVPVTFTVTAGGGTLDDETDTETPVVVATDAAGEAEATLTPGTTVETNTVQVTAAEIADAATLTATTNDVPTLSIADQTVAEGAGSTTLTVTRTGDLSGTSSANYAFADGTATGSGTDYTGTSGTVTFAATEGSKTIPVTIVQDTIDEGASEAFTVSLSSPSGAILGDAEAAISIADDDTRGVTASESALTMTEADGTGASYTVVLDSQPTDDVTVAIGIEDGSGNLLTDHDLTIGPSATLTFTTSDWATAQTVTVTAGEDTDTTTDTATLTHAPTGADYTGVTGPEVTVTVTDDDFTVTGADSSPAPTVVGDDVTATVGGTNVKLTLPSGHGVGAVTFSVPTPTVAAPAGVTFGDDPAYVDIDLGTAMLSSDATVCLAEPSGLSGTLELYHLSDGGTAWTGLDAPASTPTGFVCGETSDFSSFVVGKQDEEEELTPGQVTGLSATRASFGAGRFVDLSWTAPADGGAVVSYEVQSRRGTSGEWTTAASDVEGTAYRAVGISFAYYEYRVRALNAHGAGEWSEEATVGTPPPQEPGAPQNLAATVNSSSRVTLVWVAPTETYGNGDPIPVTGYVIERATGDEGAFHSVENNHAASPYVDTGLTAGTRYRWQVIAFNDAGFSNESNVVAATTTANQAPTGSVTITGTATQGETLTADTSGIADPDGLGTFAWQWHRDGADISEATGSTYDLVQADVGAAITVTVSWTDGGNTAESLTSTATAAVTNVNDAPTGAVTITGTATQGETLTADTSGIADADGLGTFSYQWKRDGTDIPGATASTYTLAQADVGAAIAVTVSWTDGGNTVESLTSAATAAVAAAAADDGPYGFTLSVDQASIPEGSTTTVRVTAELDTDDPTAVAPADIVLTLGVVDLSAALDTDYELPATLPTLTISSGSRVGSVDIAVTALRDAGDDVRQFNFVVESFAVTGGLTLTAPDGVETAASGSATVSIAPTASLPVLTLDTGNPAVATREGDVEGRPVTLSVSPAASEALSVSMGVAAVPSGSVVWCVGAAADCVEDWDHDGDGDTDPIRRVRTPDNEQETHEVTIPAAASQATFHVFAAHDDDAQDGAVRLTVNEASSTLGATALSEAISDGEFGSVVETRNAVSVEDDDEALAWSGTVGDQWYRQGVAIASLRLPAATGGVGAITYTLEPAQGQAFPPGLGFAAGSRTLSGTPEAGGVWTLTYAATDGVSTVTDEIKVTVAGAVFAGADDVAVTEEGATDSYTVALATPPRGSTPVTVTVTVVRGDAEAVVDTDADAAGSQNTLTFTHGNWATAQTVTVSAGADADADDEQAVLGHGFAGFGYAGVTVADVTVAVADDDTAGAVFAPSALPSLTEGGSTDYTVALATRPPGPVTVLIASDNADVTVSPASLAFAVDGWATAQRVTVTAGQDADAADDAAVLRHSFSGQYGAATQGLAVSVTDDDTAGLAFDPALLELSEGGTGQYTVALATQPAGPVTVTVTSGDTAAATVSPGELTFTTADWDTAQTVTVTAVEDDDAQDETVSLDHAVTGYAGVASASLLVAVADDETAGVTLDTSGLAGFGEGGDATWTVVLDTLPSASVTVTLELTGDGDLSVDRTALNFTTGNWDTPQTVTVSAAQDADLTDDTGQVVHTAAGASEYAGLEATAALSAADDDSAALVLSASALTLLEGGDGQSWTVKLNAQPSGAVRVAIASDNADVTVSTAVLAFTTSDWNSAQTVTARAAHDSDATNDTGVTLTHTAHTAAVGGFDGVTAALSASVTDRAPSLAIGAASVSPSEGGQASYTVKLGTRPSATVYVAVGHSGDADIQAAPASLEFRPDDWNAAQTVTVRAAQDADFVDDAAVLTHTASGGAYAGLAGENVAVSVTDDDAPGVSVAGSTTDDASVTVAEGAAESAFYSVVLTAQPTDAVTVSVSKSGGARVVALPSSLKFTPATWNIAQQVGVFARADANGVDETAVLSHSASGGGYGGVDIPSVDVSVTDDDTPALTFAPSALAFDEGGESAYEVSLATKPTVSVTVSVSSDNDEVTVDTDPDTAGEQDRLTFTASDWDTAQTVTVRATPDADAADDTAVLSHDAGGGEYEDVSGDVSVSVTDGIVPGVVVSATELDVAEGGTGTWTVRLATPPSGTVTVTVSSDNADVTLGQAAADGTRSLTFNANNWSSAREVRVRAAQDDDAVDDTAMLSHAVSGYGSVTSGPAVTVTVTDNDEAGVTISPLALDLTEDASGGGNEGSYTVVLDSQPTAPVTVTVASDNADVTVSPASLSFTTTDWATPQEVAVTAAQDADAADDTAVLSHAVSGYGAGDEAVTTGPAVSVSVTDDDTAALVLSVSSLSFEEGGAAQDYTVALATQPTATVTVAVTSDNADVTVAPARLTFTTGNWATAQTVTVTAAADADAADDTAVLSHAASGGYDEAAGSVSVSVTDDDAALVVSATEVSVSEGGVASWTVKLAAAPSGPVMVAVERSGDSDVAFSRTSLEFTTLNWDYEKVVTVEPAQDADAVDDVATFTHTASGGEYDDVAPVDVTVTVDDDETPPVTGVTVSATAVAVDEGGSGSYTVVLDSQPTGTVTVTSGNADVTAAPASLAFTTSDWDTAQTVTVSAAQDADHADDAAALTHGVSGYGTVTAGPDVSVSVTDDDAPALVLSASSLTVAEGSTANYTVALATQPAGTVSVGIASRGSDGDVTVAPASLTFTASDWNSAQTVTVSAAQDDDGIAERATLRHRVEGYGPVVFSETLVVDVTEADADAVVVTADDPLAVAEGGEAAYTVKLATRPAGGAEVTVTPGVSGDASVTVSPSVLTFTTGDWNVAQTVTVSAAEDDDGESGAATVSHAVAGYGSVETGPDVPVTVTDDDAPGVLVNGSTSDATLEVTEGASGSYTVRLSSQPSGAVTVTVTSDDTGVTVDTDAGTTGAQDELTFTTSDWDTAQTVTVSAAEDDDHTGETATLTHAVSGYGSISGGPEVSVSVTDDDTPALVLSLSSLSFDEGDAAQDYTVALATQPSGTVTVTVTSDNADITVSPSSLSFTTTDWNTAQTVTVSAASDDGVADDTATLTHSASGGGYGGVSAAVSVSVTDHDAALVLGAAGLTVAEGGSDGYTVALAARPSGTVTVTVAVTGDVDITVSPSSLSFTTSDWNVAQTVTVSAGEDDDGADGVAFVHHHVASGGYDGLAPVTIGVTESDDDGGLTFGKTAVENLAEGGSDTYTVALGVQPGGNVEVAIAHSGDGSIAASPTVLRFTASDWNVAQTVTVNAAQDADGEDDEAVLTHTASGSFYDGAGDVTVTVADDETPGVTVTPTGLSLSEGGEASYTVKLDTQPLQTATVTVSATGDADIGFDTEAATAGDQTTLSFTATDWSVAQTVTVRSARDADTADDAATLTHTVADYDSGDASGVHPVTVTVTDDTRALVFSLSALEIDEGGSGSYTVRLANGPPTGSVVVAIASDDADVWTVQKNLVFTTANWETAQTVAVQAGEDADAEADEAALTHTASGGGFDGVTGVVTVAVADNDTLPAAPADFTATPRDGEVALSWDAPAPADAVTGYEWRRDGGSWTAIANSADLTSHTVTGLTNGTAYSFGLRAVNASGAGAAATATATPQPKPGQVTGVDRDAGELRRRALRGPGLDGAGQRRRGGVLRSAVAARDERGVDHRFEQCEGDLLPRGGGGLRLLRIPGAGGERLRRRGMVGGESHGRHPAGARRAGRAAEPRGDGGHHHPGHAHLGRAHRDRRCRRTDPGHRL